MPDWLATLLISVGAATTLITFLGVMRNKVIRPLIKGYGELLVLLGQIRDASTGVQRLAREVEALAGAIANFVVGIKEQVDKNTERLDRLEEVLELVVDLEANVHRLTRQVNGEHQEGE